jgi:hypothetical protein
MNDSRRVDIFHAANYLVHQELDMIIRQFLRFDNVVEVSAHQGRDQIDVVKFGQRLGRGEDIEEADDILVSHVLQHAQFAVCPLCVNSGLERPGQLLNGHLCVLFVLVTIGGTTNLAVGSRPNRYQVCVTVGHVPNRFVQLHCVVVFLHFLGDKVTRMSSVTEGSLSYEDYHGKMAGVHCDPLICLERDLCCCCRRN